MELQKTGSNGTSTSKAVACTDRRHECMNWMGDMDSTGLFRNDAEEDGMNKKSWFLRHEDQSQIMGYSIQALSGDAKTRDSSTTLPLCCCRCLWLETWLTLLICLMGLLTNILYLTLWIWMGVTCYKFCKILQLL